METPPTPESSSVGAIYSEFRAANPHTRASRGISEPDPRLGAAIVDRLTFGGNIIETGSNSCRLAHSLAQRVS